MKCQYHEATSITMRRVSGGLCSQFGNPGIEQREQPPSRCTACTPVRMKKNELLVFVVKLGFRRSSARQA